MKKPSTNTERNISKQSQKSNYDLNSALNRSQSYINNNIERFQELAPCDLKSNAELGIMAGKPLNNKKNCIES